MLVSLLFGWYGKNAVGIISKGCRNCGSLFYLRPLLVYLIDAWKKYSLSFRDESICKA